MKTTGNTIIITGGGSGIGRGLAEAFHKLGNQVIIAGRRKDVLEGVAGANPGMKWLTLDVADAASIQKFAAAVAKEYPTANVLINNSGMMKLEDISGKTTDTTAAEETITTNLLGPIRLTAALLPQLRKQAHSAVLMVTSGLAFLPLTMTPTYCATKAAIHSYTESLRYQLRGTTTEVIEVAPPYVATELTGPQQAKDPRAMPLDEYIAETIQILKTQPEVKEVLVERVKPLRFAEASGKYEEVFRGLNESMAAHE